MAINHTQLRAFHAVALEGSFTRASKRLFVTQPTLSGQVKQLEERFDIQLFERKKRQIELTELGKALFEITSRQHSLALEAEQLLSAASELMRGHLRVGADAPNHIIPLLAIFGRRYPGVRLSITFGNSGSLLKDLFEHRTDVAILPQIQDDKRLHVLPLRPDRLVVFVAQGHPWSRRREIALADLKNQRVIMREPGSRTRAVFEDALRHAGIELPDTLEIGSREAVREAVKAKMGVGIISESELGADIRLHALQVHDARLEVQECMVCLPDRRREQAVATFLETIPERAQEPVRHDTPAAGHRD